MRTKIANKNKIAKEKKQIRCLQLLKSQLKPKTGRIGKGKKKPRLLAEVQITKGCSQTPSILLQSKNY